MEIILYQLAQFGLLGRSVGNVLGQLGPNIMVICGETTAQALRMKMGLCLLLRTVGQDSAGLFSYSSEGVLWFLWLPGFSVWAFQMVITGYYI